MTRSERSPVVQQVPAPLLTVTEVDPAADERLETVVERLAAAGPSGIAPPHCWFCGKVEAWFRCDCKDAIEAREGRRNRPRVIERNGQMFVILDPDIIERNRAWGRKRYAPPASVDTASVDNISDAAARRRAYKTEHERRRRVKRRTV